MVLPVRDPSPTVRAPVVTFLLIALNVLVFVGVQPRGDVAAENEFLLRHAAIPCEVRQGSPLTVVELVSGECHPDGAPAAVVDRELVPDKGVWRSLVTSLFLHGSWIHLLGNVLFLWVFADNVEDRLGRVGFAAFYLTGGVIATLVHAVGEDWSVVPVIGASGAIAAVMGAYLVWFPRNRILAIIPPLFFLPFMLPAAAVLGLWFVLQFMTQPETGVAWLAHVGGFVAGAGFGVVVAAFRRGPAPPPPPPRFGGYGRGGPWG